MTRDRLKTAVVGAGYVGIAKRVGLAEQGRDIVLVEQDPARLAALADGRIPFHEPGLPEAYATQHAAGRIVPSAELPGYGPDLIVVCVGTPIDDTGYADVSHVAHALEKAAPAIAAGASCVIRSTLPVGSAARLVSRPGVVPERLFVAPEFLRRDVHLRTSAGPRGSWLARSANTWTRERSPW
jgi:UDPglucose 6-dehydrogenase